MKLANFNAYKLFAYFIVTTILIVYLVPTVTVVTKFIQTILDGKGSINGFFSSSKYTEALSNSIKLSLIVSTISTAIGFYFAWNLFYRHLTGVIIFLLCMLLLIPPDIQAISILYMKKFIFLDQSSSIFALGFSHILSTIPFSVIIIYIGLYTINKKLILSSKDLGGTFFDHFSFVILPLLKNSIFASMLFSFILSLNEYQKTKYLMGSREYISSLIYSKLNSGIIGTEFNFYFLVFLNIVLSMLLIYIVGRRMDDDN